MAYGEVQAGGWYIGVGLPSLGAAMRFLSKLLQEVRTATDSCLCRKHMTSRPCLYVQLERTKTLAC